MLIKKSKFCQHLVEMFQFLANCKSAAILQFRMDEPMKKRLDFL